MIVLDTNVLSELIRPRPDTQVVAWLLEQPRAQLFTTAVSLGEMLYGARLLPEAQRRRKLLQEVRAIFTTDMAGRVLPYDGDAADAHAAFAVIRRGHGRPVGQSDAMIAGIARSRGATLATRNVRDFDGCDVALVDPWR